MHVQHILLYKTDLKLPPASETKLETF